MPRFRPFAALLTFAVATTAYAADPQVVQLWPKDPPATRPYDTDAPLRPRKTDPRPIDLFKVGSPTLTVYPAAHADAATPGVVICAGGGYGMQSIVYEGVDIAHKFAEHGVTAFVLRYRMPGGHAPAAGTLPEPQQDVLRAIQLVRARAAEWKVDPEKIGVVGFSAGGHLAATAATLYDQAGTLAEKAGGDATAKLSARPDFAVLVYAVITMGPPNTHGGTRKNLIGVDADDATVARFSAEQHVTRQTPPLFIVHAEDDNTVPVANAIMMAGAAAQQRVPCEVLLLHNGGHGFSLGRPNTESTTWFDRMVQWMTARGLLRP